MQSCKKGGILTRLMAPICLYAFAMLYCSLMPVTSGFAETVKVTIAQTNNLNGKLFPSKASD